MAAPNLLTAASMISKTAILEATTTETDLIGTGVTLTNHTIVVEAIHCSNIHATLAAYVTVIRKRGGTDHYQAYQWRIANKAGINILLGKSSVLEEGDSIRVIAGPNSSGMVYVEAPYSDYS